MKLSSAFISILAAINAATASSWFGKSGKSAYNKWHETELERWLSDHDIPYVTPADRKDLEEIVKKNWEVYVVAPYQEWDPKKLNSYLVLKGIETKESAEANKESLLAKVQASWYETEDKAQEAWSNVKDWILDTWTESQLRAFLDKHGISTPQSHKRDTLLQDARENYQTIADRMGEAAAYPGNWLYETWSDSDLKEWLDANGFPAPQPTNRDKLIAIVRRNSRLAYLQMQDQAASATASARAAYQTVTDAVIDSWGESELKDFADKNGIKVPHGTKANELRAIIRKNRADIMGDTLSASAASVFDSATSRVGNEYAKATNDAAAAAQSAFDAAVDTWSQSRLKAYLDARGIPVPQASETDELRALVRKNHHKVASGLTAWTFDDFSYENLKKYLMSFGNDAAKAAGEKKDATREDLVSAAQSAYSSASSAGGDKYASMTSYLTKQTDAVKAPVFDMWSESELKKYLDNYGVKVPQGSTADELRALARKHATYFRYGTDSPSETFQAKLNKNLEDTVEWLKEKVGMSGSAAVRKASDEARADAKAKAKEIRDEL
jgi:nucleotide-binding universal stress UspA family protein